MAAGGISAQVAVVGAGPSGSILALLLARAGCPVTLIDRRTFPRDKACGDGLIPDALAVLRRVGLYDRIRRLAHGGNTLSIFGPSRIGVDVEVEWLCLRREVLDHELLTAALAAGASFLRGQVTNIVPHPRGAHLELADGTTVRTELAVVATGADVSLLESLGMVERAEPSATAIRGYVRSSQPIDRLVVSFDRSIIPGYAWIFPVGDQTLNVGVGVFYGARAVRSIQLRALLDRFVASFPLAKALMQGASLGPVRGARLRSGLSGTRPWNGGRVMAAGESLGATFPFTGEGIGKAMETSEALADSILEWRATRDPAALASYARRLEALRPRYVGYEVAERWLPRTWINDFLCLRARRSPRLRQTITSILNETADPREIFSVKGVLKALIA